MGRIKKKKNTEGGILHFCLMFLPCVNESDDNDDDDDDEGAGGGKKEILEILSTATSTQSPNHKTNREKTDISKQLSKQAIRQAKLREITKCLLPGLHNSRQIYIKKNRKI